MESTFSIFNYSTGLFQTIEKDAECSARCEEICIKFAGLNKINPLVRLLFGICVREKTGIKWIPNNQNLDPDQKYEFRMRFYMTSSSPFIPLKKMSVVSYKYLYHQIKNDLIKEQIAELKYPKHKNEVLGLAATMMYLELIEKKSSYKKMKASYRDYLSEIMYKEHRPFIRRKLLNALKVIITKNNKKLVENQDYIYYVFGLYFNRVLELAPNYFLETYDCEGPCLPEEDLQTPCPVQVQVNLAHPNEPGLRIFYHHRKEVSLCSITDIVCDNIK